MNYYNNELYHYGVLGMKWGHHKARPVVSKNLKKYKQNMDEAAKTYNKHFTKDNEYKYNMAKLKYNANAELERMNSKNVKITQKSKHRSKLESEFKRMGLSDKEAEAAANKRIRTEKVLAGAAAITVTACAAYAANKYLKKRVDGYIKTGETLQRIEKQNTNGQLYDMFYVAKGKHDTKRYAGLLGATRQQQNGEAYLMKLKANSTIKVASKHNAMKTFEELYKNDGAFRESVKSKVGANFSGNNKVDISNLNKHNIEKMYENFNANIMDIRGSGSGADKKFYEALKSKGYGAIQDVNDMKFSGYNAKNPLIVFDNSGGKITTESVSKMSNMMNDAAKEYSKAMLEQVVADTLRKVGIVTTTGTVGATAAVYNSSNAQLYGINNQKNQ